MAAGEGTRLRPLTERWPKPVLPIDGRPVLATLLRELAAAELHRVWLVTGHLAEQVERLAGDGSGFGVEVRSVRGSRPLSARQTRCNVHSTAGAAEPLIVTAADTLFRRGDSPGLPAEFTAAKADGAVAVRTDPPPGPGRHAIRRSAGRVLGHERRGPGEPMVGRAALGDRPGRLRNGSASTGPPTSSKRPSSRRSTTARTVISVEIGKTRDLTYPLDLVEENFPYLQGT